MKKLIVTFMLSSLSIVTSAAENGLHSFSCLDNLNHKRITIQISGKYPDITADLAKVTVTKILTDSPYEEVIAQATNAKVKLITFYGVNTNNHTIDNLNIDLGRSGKLAIKLLSSESKTFEVKSNLLHFNLPVATDMECRYSFGMPRPAVTGSN